MHVLKSQLCVKEALATLKRHRSSDAEDTAFLKVLKNFKPAYFKRILLTLLHFYIFIWF